MTNRIEYTVEEQIAKVRLNRPEKHNALDYQTFLAIASTQREIARDSTVRAVVVSGAGVDFCSGLDVKSMMQDRRAMRRLLWKWRPWRPNLAQRVGMGWRELPVPVIAAIHGRCWGGGLQIALGADLRVVSPKASLSIMESRWGLIPDMGGTLALRDLISRDQAMWLTMSAAELSGEEALRHGLATAVDDEPLEAASAMAARLAERSPDAVGGVKKLYRKSWTGSAGLALARETIYQLRVLSSANQRIAVRRQLGEQLDYRRARKW
jgi:enoyl-CoA hydratase/carnithine racemase